MTAGMQLAVEKKDSSSASQRQAQDFKKHTRLTAGRREEARVSSFSHAPPVRCVLVLVCWYFRRVGDGNA